jgi:hypothetical protein
MIQSQLLLRFSELRHGFSERSDGSMGLKFTDDPGQTPARRAAFLKKIGFTLDQLATNDQQHGTRIVKVEQPTQEIELADGLLSVRPNVALGIKVADCLPIFFYDPTTGNQAAIHAGWRGLTQGIIEKVVSDLVAQGSSPNDLYVWIGPHIRVCHYRNDPASPSYQQKVDFFGPSEFLDLTREAVRQLEGQGIEQQHVDADSDCTACHPERYYSYYASHGQPGGLMLGVLGRVDGTTK